MKFRSGTSIKLRIKKNDDLKIQLSVIITLCWRLTYPNDALFWFLYSRVRGLSFDITDY